MDIQKWILLVEDNLHDAHLAVRALGMGAPAPEVVVTRDGVDALDCLYRRNLFAGRPASDPVVIVLDLKMPRVTGADVLKQIKGDPQFSFIPVVIFSSSREESDLMRCYQLGANAYVVKPVNYKSFASTLTALGSFWTGMNQLPTPQPRDNPGNQARVTFAKIDTNPTRISPREGEKSDSHLAA